MPNRAELLKQKLLQSLALPWQELLPNARVEAILAQENIAYRNSVYSPVVTLWTMIGQALDPDKSLSNAVKRVISWLSAAGESCPSADTGAYSKARNRLPEKLLQQLIPEVADALEGQVPVEQQWCGRRVQVYDGTTVLMSDTAVNQAAYPQAKTQRAGCGFPIANVVVVFSLLTGAVVAGCIAAHDCSEIVMSRLLYQRLDPEDVVLADRAYGNYVDLALVQQQRADGVFRKHQARTSDFRRGKRLGKGDHLVVWRKPKARPKHRSGTEFAALPASLVVREVAFCVARRGFRTQKLVVVTTLIRCQTLQRRTVGPTLWVALASRRSESAPSQNHLEAGAGERKNA
jgi:hypothetical protein